MKEYGQIRAILNSMELRPPNEAIGSLHHLARLSLCARWHQGQIDDVVLEWEKGIKDAAVAYEELWQPREVFDLDMEWTLSQNPSESGVRLSEKDTAVGSTMAEDDIADDRMDSGPVTGRSSQFKSEQSFYDFDNVNIPKDTGLRRSQRHRPPLPAMPNLYGESPSPWIQERGRIISNEDDDDDYEDDDDDDDDYEDDDDDDDNDDYEDDDDDDDDDDEEQEEEEDEEEEEGPDKIKPNRNDSDEEGSSELRLLSTAGPTSAQRDKTFVYYDGRGGSGPGKSEVYRVSSSRASLNVPLAEKGSSQKRRETKPPSVESNAEEGIASGDNEALSITQGDSELDNGDSYYDSNDVGYHSFPFAE